MWQPRAANWIIQKYYIGNKAYNITKAHNYDDAWSLVIGYTPRCTGRLLFPFAFLCMGFSEYFKFTYFYHYHSSVTHTDCKTRSFSDLICTIIHNQLNIILFPNCCSKTQFNFCFSFLPIEFLKMLQMSLPPPTISLTEILDLNSKFPVPENCNYS